MGRSPSSLETNCIDCQDEGLIAFYGVDGEFQGWKAPAGLGRVFSVAMNPAGRFLVGGATRAVEVGKGLLMRLSPAGEVLQRAEPPTFDTQLAVAFEADGRAVVGGSGFGTEPVWRFEADDATPDPGFHVESEGRPPPCNASQVAVQPDQRILVSGDCGIRRFEPDGQVDPGFDAGMGDRRRKPCEAFPVAAGRSNRVRGFGPRRRAADGRPGAIASFRPTGSGLRVRGKDAAHDLCSGRRRSPFCRC